MYNFMYENILLNDYQSKKFSKQFGEAVHERISNRVKSISEWEEEFGVCKGYINNLRKGRTSISFDRVVRIAVMLDMSVKIDPDYCNGGYFIRCE